MNSGWRVFAYSIAIIASLTMLFGTMVGASIDLHHGVVAAIVTASLLIFLFAICAAQDEYDR